MGDTGESLTRSSITSNNTRSAASSESPFTSLPFPNRTFPLDWGVRLTNKISSHDLQLRQLANSNAYDRLLQVIPRGTSASLSTTWRCTLSRWNRAFLRDAPEYLESARFKKQSLASSTQQNKLPPSYLPKGDSLLYPPPVEVELLRPFRERGNKFSTCLCWERGQSRSKDCYGKAKIKFTQQPRVYIFGLFWWFWQIFFSPG